MKSNQVKLRPETAARYAAQHEASKLANATRKRAWIETEINEATRDGESFEYIAWLRAKLP